MMPAYPWSQRPDDLPLTADEVCSALAESHGSVRRAADALKVGSLTLRKFVERSPKARAVIREMGARLAEDAATKLKEALEDSDNRRVDWAIRFILNSNNARSLGWASSDGSSDAVQAAHGNQVNVNLVLPPVQWADGTKIGPPQRQIASDIIDLVKNPEPPDD